jgi:hypothetical protein
VSSRADQERYGVPGDVAVSQPRHDPDPAVTDPDPPLPAGEEGAEPGDRESDHHEPDHHDGVVRPVVPLEREAPLESDRPPIHARETSMTAMRTTRNPANATKERGTRSWGVHA